MNIKIIFFFVILFFSCNPENTKKKLAEKIVDNTNKYSSISYDINYKIKHFNTVSDTTKIFAKIDLIKDTNDSVFGGYVWINSDSVDRYYNTKNLYIIYHKEKVIIKYQKHESFGIKSKDVGETINIHFLNSKKLLDYIDDSTIVNKITQENLLGNEVWKWNLSFPDEEYVKNIKENKWIDRNSYSIKKMSFSVDMQNENQYNEWNINNIKYDKISPDELENRFLKYKKKYVVKNYVKKAFKKPLNTGTHFPKLEGKLYGDSKIISLKDLEANIVLLDFWYMDCPHCIKAFHHLNDLYSNYSNKGLKILSINPFNNNSKDLDRLPNFLKENRINFPIMFINRNDAKKYRVFGYPTFYILDKKGNIIYSKSGYSDKIAEKIDSIIKINLSI